MLALDNHGVGTLQVVHDLLEQLGEADGAARLCGLGVEEVQQHCDGLRVCLRLEHVVSLLQHLLQRVVVCDDPVVHHHEVVGRTRRDRVCVDVARHAVRGPTRVCDTHVAVQDHTVQVGPASHRVHQRLHGALPLDDLSVDTIAVDADSARVVSSVFQALQALDEDVSNLANAVVLLVVQVRENAAHCCRDSPLRSLSLRFVWNWLLLFFFVAGRESQDTVEGSKLSVWGWKEVEGGGGGGCFLLFLVGSVLSHWMVARNGTVSIEGIKRSLANAATTQVLCS